MTVVCGLVLAGCAAPGKDTAPPPGAASAGQLYRCDQNTEFRVRFVDDSAVIDGTRGLDVLLRDAGGVTPEQTVFSNPRVRAEFGLGTNGQQALLHYPAASLDLRCARVPDRDGLQGGFRGQ
ncbi:MAG: hypothetical protein LH479_14675 [Polaromonas sp.]|nr:hypothetical protein [Polaromonas sp.]